MDVRKRRHAGQRFQIRLGKKWRSYNGNHRNQNLPERSRKRQEA